MNNHPDFRSTRIRAEQDNSSFSNDFIVSGPSGYAHIPGGSTEVKLDNGYRVSIQRTNRHYCDRTTAETAIIGPDGGFVPWQGDDVQGWQSAEEVSATIAHAASLRATPLTDSDVNILHRAGIAPLRPTNEGTRGRAEALRMRGLLCFNSQTGNYFLSAKGHTALQGR